MSFVLELDNDICSFRLISNLDLRIQELMCLISEKLRYIIGESLTYKTLI